MKLTYFAAFAISSLLTVGAFTVVSNAQPSQADPCAAAVNPCASADPGAAVNSYADNPGAVAENPCAGATTIVGSFEGVAHPTLGTASIIEENGKRYLEFDGTFHSDNGPDLFVLLHKEAVPQNYSPDQFVNLGDLQSIEGSQRYEIPADVSVEDFASAVIWCRQFNVTFGYAAF